MYRNQFQKFLFIIFIFMNCLACSDSVNFETSTSLSSEISLHEEISGSLDRNDLRDSRHYYDLISLGDFSAGEYVRVRGIPSGFNMLMALLNIDDLEELDEDAILEQVNLGSHNEAEEIFYTFEESDSVWLFVSSYESYEVGDYDIYYEIGTSAADDL